MLNPKLLAEAFPINKVEVFFDALDHSDFLGFSWERIAEGKFPVGYKSNDSDYNQVGKTGGEKMHKLTIDELPSHKHTINYGGAGTGVQGAVPGSDNNYGPNDSFIQAAGGGQPHENRPPYIVMAFWKRIA